MKQTRKASKESRQVFHLVMGFISFVLFAAAVFPVQMTHALWRQSTGASTRRAEAGAARSENDESLRSLPLSSQPASPCGCKDVKDILYRIAEATVAINAFKTEIAQYEAQEKSTSSPEMFSTAAKAALKARVKKVLDFFVQSGPSPPNRATAATDPHSCKVSIDETGTPCLLEAVEHHENIHQDRCNTMMKQKSLLGQWWPASDYRDGTRMAEYAQEEIDGYKVEIAILRSDLQRLPASCRLQEWFGVITYNESIHRLEQSSEPGRNPNRQPSIGDSVIQNVVKSYETTSVLEATVVVFPGSNTRQDAMISASWNYDFTSGRTTLLRAACHITGKHEPRIVTTSIETKDRSSDSGWVTKQILISLSTRYIGFAIPEIEYTSQRSHSTSGDDPCGVGGTRTPQPPPGKGKKPGKLVEIQLPPNQSSPNVLLGSKTERIGENRTITFTWNLIRKP